MQFLCNRNMRTACLQGLADTKKPPEMISPNMTSGMLPVVHRPFRRLSISALGSAAFIYIV